MCSQIYIATLCRPRSGPHLLCGFNVPDVGRIWAYTMLLSG